MAIVFTEGRNKQLYLAGALFVIVLLTLFVIWRGFFKKDPSFEPAEEKIAPQKSVDMRWDVLEQNAWVGRELLRIVTPPASERRGTDNPFLPSRE